MCFLIFISLIQENVYFVSFQENASSTGCLQRHGFLRNNWYGQRFKLVHCFYENLQLFTRNRWENSNIIGGFGQKRREKLNSFPTISAARKSFFLMVARWGNGWTFVSDCWKSSFDDFQDFSRRFWPPRNVIFVVVKVLPIPDDSDAFS